ncbi:MAG TPA: HTH domain-containing protein [Ruania sp.]|nr:HTH domain-containing protein [Ruania sp.]
MSSEQIEDAEATTRERVRSLIIELGPITAAELAAELDLTSAAIRRHLTALERSGHITLREESPAVPRGRGRPAKRYIATPSAHPQGEGAYADMAVQALQELSEKVGPEALAAFAEQRAGDLKDRYRERVEAAGGDLHERAAVLAEALSEDGFAASSRPLGGVAVQLCQGHCPVQQIAAHFPQICEAETRAFADLLGVHVQRLATLAGGEHVCTTHIPVTIPTRGKE